MIKAIRIWFWFLLLLVSGFAISALIKTSIAEDAHDYAKASFFLLVTWGNAFAAYSIRRELRGLK